MRFDTLLLDLDGTLVDSMPSIVHATQSTFASKGLAVPAEAAVRRYVADGFGLEFFLPQLHPVLEPADIPGWIEDWRRFYNSESYRLTTPYPGAVETLRQLHEAGTNLVVVSNKGREALERTVASYGLAPYISLVVGEDPGQPKKPDPAVLTRRVLPALPGAAPERMLMVGDSESDLRFGHNAGVRTCWARYGFGNEATCAALDPDHTIASVTELADLV